MSNLFGTFLLLTALLSAGYAKNSLVTREGDQLFLYQVTDSAHYDSKKIPPQAAEEAFRYDSSVYRDYFYQIEGWFGSSLKITGIETPVARIGNQIEALPDFKDLPATRVFNPPCLIAILLLLIYSIGWSIILRSIMTKERGINLFPICLLLALLVDFVCNLFIVLSNYHLSGSWHPWVFYFLAALLLPALLALFLRCLKSRKEKKSRKEWELLHPSPEI